MSEITPDSTFNCVIRGVAKLTVVGKFETWTELPIFIPPVKDTGIGLVSETSAVLTLS